MDQINPEDIMNELIYLSTGHLELYAYCRWFFDFIRTVLGTILLNFFYIHNFFQTWFYIFVNALLFQLIFFFYIYYCNHKALSCKKKKFKFVKT